MRRDNLRHLSRGIYLLHQNLILFNRALGQHFQPIQLVKHCVFEGTGMLCQHTKL